MKDSTAAANLRKSMDDDSSTDNLIKIVGEVLKTTKSEGSYLEWMKESFESANTIFWKKTRTVIRQRNGVHILSCLLQKDIQVHYSG